jgi:dihydroorotate dehydrogenase
MIEPEFAHRVAVGALKLGLVPHSARVEDPILRVNMLGLSFPNPVGLAAGFDKNAEVVDCMLNQGFGFAEVGTVTPKPQRGNPPPRLFRLERDKAVINRLGFNNQGLEVVARRMAKRRENPHSGIVGANIGPNRDSADPIADCAAGIRALHGFADYLVINVSSPNTPGLRALQGRDALSALLATVLSVRSEIDSATPVFVKIAPDLCQENMQDIAEVVVEAGIDGLIATNTTIQRPETLADSQKHETGGLSGWPLLEPSTAVLAEMYRLTSGRLPLIGVGGVANGRDAYAKIRAGASLVQLYTALVYHGPGLVNQINKELANLLRADGFSSVSEAVGTGASSVHSAGN